MQHGRLLFWGLWIGLLALVAGRVPTPEARRGPGPDTLQVALYVAEGRASYYGARWAGQRTASGEAFDPEALTAAHPTLPFGARVRVTNLRNGRSVVVRINDRGPHVPGRIIDVSYAAARALGMVRSGTVPVRIEWLPETAVD
ncbi:septal ring lytic transglycosylase RlpA family protein [Rhodothermus marinus]|uniref:septal ring lytic transglycosylase RlpA family protein n=1 Tax=Rhodothermus marinus TaxID=29549 RepID=UPI0012BA4A2A|nr:septal ring lytic transglycosylase RlpA family protein [Rhodothermus marinus]BBM68271.1 hypothetical protein RmaAA213_01170 [Rhodothermus marinus]BBM71245.1 hypothetical protein RmaAA338_01100 [Rhodothermus marinus]